MSSNGDIRCPVCHRMLGKINGNKIIIIHGDRCSRVYGQGVVILDCDRVHGHIPCPGKAEIELPKGAICKS